MLALVGKPGTLFLIMGKVIEKKGRKRKEKEKKKKKRKIENSISVGRIGEGNISWHVSKKAFRITLILVTWSKHTQR